MAECRSTPTVMTVSKLRNGGLAALIINERRKVYPGQFACRNFFMQRNCQSTCVCREECMRVQQLSAQQVLELENKCPKTRTKLFRSAAMSSFLADLKQL